MMSSTAKHSEGGNDSRGHHQLQPRRPNVTGDEEASTVGDDDSDIDSDSPIPHTNALGWSY